MDEKLAAGDDGRDPDICDLIAPVQLEGFQVGTVIGNAGDSLKLEEELNKIHCGGGLMGL